MGSLPKVIINVLQSPKGDNIEITIRGPRKSGKSLIASLIAKVIEASGCAVEMHDNL